MDTEMYWNDLSCRFLRHTEVNQLRSNHTISKYRTTLKRMALYAEQNEINEYSPEVGMAFFEAEKKLGLSEITLGYRRACIRQLNQYLFGYKYWQRDPRNKFKYERHIDDRASRKCPSQFEDGYTDFLSQLKREGLKQPTIDAYQVSCTAILRYYDLHGVTQWANVNTQLLLGAFDQTKNKYHFITHAKRFFRYLAENSYISENIAEILPRMRKQKTVPSVYTRKEIDQLLNSMERFTPQGKRDYAIVLLILRTGLRQSDVRELCLCNVNLETSHINIIQYKTGIPLTISIAKDAEVALRDYIVNGREKSDSDRFFLNGQGQPMTTSAVTHIVSRHIKDSGIVPGKRHIGPHSLRMTFASQLVEENIPYEVVKTLLGHASSESTRHYVEFSTEGLRTCALEVPPPAASFLHYLQGGY